MKLSVVLPLLLPDAYCVWMTRFCIAAMREQAKEDFELVVVETGSEHFAPQEPCSTCRASGVCVCGINRGADQRIDKYIHFPERTTYVHDWNAGAEAASGDFLVHMGNDVFVGPDWDAALLEPFGRFRDCGVTCTAAMEPGHAPIGHPEPIPVITEGMFAPMMCFRREWRLDPLFEGGYSDSDLVMRMYDAGLRAYRNNASVCTHLQLVTWKRAFKDKGEGQTGRGEELFYARWGGNPTWMYAMIRAGGVQYGKEHFAACALTPPQERKRG